MILLIIFALIFALLGFIFLSEATSGVGLICVACLFGIFARISQASSHHKELINKLSEDRE